MTTCRQLKAAVSRLLPTLLVLVLLTMLSGCTLSYDPETRASLRQPTCIALLNVDVNCENKPSSYANRSLHADFDQQMLPIHQREEVIDSEFEDLRKTHD